MHMRPGRPRFVQPILLLTATINPVSFAPALVRRDSDTRRKDYLRAVSFYAAKLNPDECRIVLAENSGAPVADVVSAAARHGHSISVLSYTGDPVLSRRGKGNGEAELIDRSAAWIVNDVGGAVPVIKVTGRIIVSNIRRFLVSTDEHEILCRLTRDLRKADTRLMSFTAGAWLLHFANLAAEVDAATGFSLEHAVAKRLYAGIVDGQLRWARMKHEPPILRVQRHRRYPIRHSREQARTALACGVPAHSISSLYIAAFQRVNGAGDVPLCDGVSRHR